MEVNLDEKIAIVTGAGRGLGAAIARALAESGAQVAVNDINPDRAERVAAEAREAGGRVLGIQADVSNRFQCVKLVEEVRNTWHAPDILINNAFVAPSSTILQMDEWDWNRCLEVNLKGTFFMSQLCGRVMHDSGRSGVIINVISNAGIEHPLAGRAAFCASQAAVVGFARECAREYEAYGIRVHTLLTNRLLPQSVEPGGVTRAALSLCSKAGDMASEEIAEHGIRVI